MNHPTEGKINVHRSIMDNWIWERGEYVKAWLHMLLLANNRDHTIKLPDGPVSLQRGQFVMSKRNMQQEWHWTWPVLQKFLSLLQEKRAVTISTLKFGCLITILNYDAYNPICAEDDYVKNPTVNRSTPELPQTGQNDTLKNVQRLETGDKRPRAALSFVVPPDSEVEQFCNSYKDEARGIQGIPEVWWRSTLQLWAEKKNFPKNWREAMRQNLWIL